MLQKSRPRAKCPSNFLAETSVRAADALVLQLRVHLQWSLPGSETVDVLLQVLAGNPSYGHNDFRSFLVQANTILIQRQV